MSNNVVVGTFVKYLTTSDPELKGSVFRRIEPNSASAGRSILNSYVIHVRDVWFKPAAIPLKEYSLGFSNVAKYYRVDF